MLSRNKVRVQPLSGKPVLLDVEQYDTIGDVKRKLEAQENIPTYRQRLIFDGKELENDWTVMSCGIVDNSSIDLEQQRE